MDRGREGVELEMSGGKYQGVKQKAVVEFLCDQRSEERRRGVSLKDDEEEDGDDKDGKKTTDDGEGGTLSFTSYETVGEIKVLSLEWHTKYACENAPESDGKPSGGHWGFFTWLIVM